MKSFLFDMSDVIIYATGALWLITGVWSGIQILGEAGAASVGLISGVLVMLLGILFSALHCLICFVLLDIRRYVRLNAQMLKAGR